MSSFKDVYLTKRGTQLLARSVTEGLRLEFTKMVTGNGIYSEEERTKASLLERTELKSQKQEFGFSSVAVAESNIIKLKAMVTNIGLTEGYRITEIGIVARLEGKTEEEPILYSIAVAEEADYLPSQETPISYIQEYYTKISNAENIIINLEMGSYALAEDMQSVLKPQFKENEEIENIESGESIFSIFAKIKRAIRGLIEHKTSGDHDSRYYTEAEMDGKLSGKSDTTHNHDSRYLQKSAVINSNTVTETGYALDARQANPNVSGSLGAQINSLNTNLAMKQDASTAITTSNIGSQSVNYASSSGVANTAVYGVDDNTGHDTDFFMSRSNTAGYRKNNSSFFDRNGIYCTDVNTEYANDWGVILTLRAPGVDWMFQVWFKTNGDIFVRRSINTGTHNFTAWKQISIVA